MAELKKFEDRITNAPKTKSIKELFDTDQWENMVDGIYGQYLGAHQLVDQIKEKMGVVPKGTVALSSQEARKDLELLRDENKGQFLRGAGGFKVAGDIAPLLLAPVAGPVRGAIGGFGIGMSGFSEEERPELADKLPMAIGLAGVGGVLGKVFSRAAATKAKSRGDD